MDLKKVDTMHSIILFAAEQKVKRGRKEREKREGGKRGRERRKGGKRVLF